MNPRKEAGEEENLKLAGELWSPSKETAQKFSKEEITDFLSDCERELKGKLKALRNEEINEKDFLKNCIGSERSEFKSNSFMRYLEVECNNPSMWAKARFSLLLKPIPTQPRM